MKKAQWMASLTAIADGNRVCLMNRLVVVIWLALFSSGCVHRWVGRPVAQLEKEYGTPWNIRAEGENKVYYYPDTLAGRGEMTFTIDRTGIIRGWCATSNVPGPWQDDLFDDGTFGTGINPGTNVGLNPGGPNGGVGSRARNLPQSLPAGTCR
jgi:hypothetical protein